MKDTSIYKGIIPAFYACYDENGQVSGERVRKLTSYFRKAGVKGLYVNGSSGECLYLTVAERKLILENVMAERGDMTIIAHVAANGIAESRELAAHAEKMGVHAIAFIPPIYFHLPPAGIADYWNQISDAAPNTDFFIYNIPQLAGVSLTLPLLQEMKKNPRLIGVKNSSMPVYDIQMWKAELGTEGVVMNGPDEQYIGGRIMGADGGIGGTYGAMPELFVKLEKLYAEGSIAAAQRLQFQINEIIGALCSGKASMYGVIKEVLRRSVGLDVGGVRRPLSNITAEDEAAVTTAMALIAKAKKEVLV